MKYRQESKRQRSSSGSLHKWPQWLGLGQIEDGSDLPCGHWIPTAFPDALWGWIGSRATKSQTSVHMGWWCWRHQLNSMHYNTSPDLCCSESISRGIRNRYQCLIARSTWLKEALVFRLIPFEFMSCTNIIFSMA